MPEPAPITGVHPYAEQFPMLPEDELNELAESIRANGLRNPVVITPEGLILDGRNRAAACEIAGVTPDTVTYGGDDLAEYVIDANITRRNMTTGQRAMATAQVLEMAGQRKDGQWDGARGRAVIRPDSGTNPKTWKNLLSQAGVILDYARDLVPRVMSRDLTLDAAFKRAEEIKNSAEHEKIRKREEAKRKRDEEKAEAEKNARIIADLTMAGSKYLDLINSGAMTPAAAWAAHREDTRKERERQEQERKARSDLYSGMARALKTIGSYGKHEDIAYLMDVFDPAELNPPQDVWAFERDNLDSAAHFIEALIKWGETRG